ncbi:plasmid replication protein RepCa2 [Tianweitania sp. Rool2]|uniref:Plasmid replication protein RepCa2 n=2 Tax=Oryzicola mucosus TaxID=2767425 RepID=A0A8J6PYM2_9HYPH|nr:plasmid replication protein RepCa2 [Oryzicola mucosus]
MAQKMTIASFRRVTPGILASARLAMANNLPDTSKAEVAVLLKKAAPILGIDGTTYHIMDILLGLSQAEDWKGRRRPIVAISNAKLAEYTMRSERTVTRCIKRLVEAGILAYRDSPTGRRFVYRSDDGVIDKGYGLDFTPARARVDELKAAVDIYRREVNANMAASRDVSRLSRAILDVCESIGEEAAAIRAELHAAINASMHPAQKAVLLTDIYERAIEEPNEAERHELSGEGDIDVRPNIITTQEINKNSNGAALQTASEKSCEPNVDANPSHVADISRSTSATTNVLHGVTTTLVKAACGETQQFIGVEFNGNAAISGSAGTMRRMIGVTDGAWDQAVGTLGHFGSAVILATVLEKTLRDPEQISRPDGYFRAMTERAREGGLRLHRTLYGLAKGKFVSGREPIDPNADGAGRVL